NAANRQRPTNPGRRPVKRGVPLAVKLGAAVVVLALLIFLGVKLIGGAKEAGVERFVDNVYVNGVALTGYTKEDGFQLMHDLRDQWLNTTYPLTFQGRTWEFSPASVNAALDFDEELERAWNLGHVGDRATRREIVKGLQQVPAEFVCEPTYDAAALDAYVQKIADEVYVAPVDAEVTLTEIKPVITRASQNGWALDTEALKATLEDLIQSGKGDLNLPVNEILPTIASDNMEMDMISEIKTDVTFRGFDSRSNVRTALNHFNLFTVYPGDTVSFNDVVGPRTEALGFKEAPEYAGSKEEMGVGGGVCQASTTLYNAMIQAGMTIIERHNHTMTVSYVEPSQDAAVNYGKKDFVFRNDTEHAIYIYTNVSKEWATVTVYGTRPQYKLVLESIITSERKSDVIGYQDDLEGKHVYYVTDEPVLYKEGHGSCHSEGWLVSYDWDSQQEVNRVQINNDVYSAGVNVYWRGIHNPDGTTTTATEPPSQW
ncbi:MAG: VanW family protein, partial [Clostridia bacterium]|nr:VanW family protein [Clostridia bacterium]